MLSPEAKFFSFLATRPDLAQTLSERIPLEIFSPVGKELLATRKFGEPGLGTEQEATQFLKLQLLALLGKEIGKAQRNGLNTSRIKQITALLDDCESAFEPLPIESFESILPSIREVIPTGVDAIDTQIQGLARGDLGVVAMASGRGKSCVMINFAVAAAISGKTVLYLSVADQGKNELVPRIDSCILEEPVPVPASLVQLHERHKRASDRIAGKIWVADYTDRECYLDDIERAIVEKKSDLVIVDHGDDVLCQYSSDLSITRHSLRVVYLSLKKLAVKHQTCIWTASQMAESTWNYQSASTEGLSESKVGKSSSSAVILTFTGGQPYIEGQVVCTIAKARRSFTERSFRLSIDHLINRIW